MAQFCNQFDKICDQLNATIIYAHHHSKGSLVGKAFFGSGKINNELNIERTFIFSDTTVHVIGKSVYTNEPNNFNDIFTYYCEWGPGNYSEHLSSNNIINIHMTSTTSTTWRYLAYYDEINGKYSITYFSYKSEPFYYVI